MYNSFVFYVFVELYNHHHYLIPELFFIPQKKHCIHRSHFPFCHPKPNPEPPLILYLCRLVYSGHFIKLASGFIHEECIFLCLNNIPFYGYTTLKKIFWPLHVACRILFPPPGMEPMPPALVAWSLNSWTIGKPHICQCSHPLMDIWVSTFWLLWTLVQVFVWTWFPFSWLYIQEWVMLGHVVTIYHLLRNCQLLSKVAAQFYISHHQWMKVLISPPSHSLTNACFYLSFLL